MSTRLYVHPATSVSIPGMFIKLSWLQMPVEEYGYVQRTCEDTV